MTSRRKKKPKVVCLCGSTKFKEEYYVANFEETMKGHIVLSVGWFSHSAKDIYFPTPDEKKKLDELHFRKIEIADEIVVVSVDGYIGDSTRNEIAHAAKLGKKIRWYENPDKETSVMRSKLYGWEAARVRSVLKAKKEVRKFLDDLEV